MGSWSTSTFNCKRSSWLFTRLPLIIKTAMQLTGANQLLKLPEFQDAGKAHELMSFLADSKENLPLPDARPPHLAEKPVQLLHSAPERAVDFLRLL